ncbi:response regulator [Acidiferrobacter sp.]|uniref:response regulator n=1 Tax=Acidiferrobacter sp. TaxID=1872107 RepID=UPI00260AB29B|nr:response regulator [Acidiferrobacter sp.]
MPRILLVDDDARLRELLTRYLSEQGFTATAVPDGRAMDKALARAAYDLLILDIMLPGQSGLALCQRLRAEGRYIPLLMLTARGDDADRIMGLDLGADDYLAKPFNPRELVARINAVLRRQRPPDDKKLHFGRYELDIHARSLTADGVPVDLTTAEFDLLRVFATHPRQPLSRDILMQLARGRDHMPFDRSIDVRISRLRRLLEDDPAKPCFIQTVWGFGYVFNPGDTP